ncbi:uncharacterized protein LOC113279020 [Papaver somniferum]|uniref:uncharacterized protein LOC113279020 n=1 Tax=Papaver somniferum TaxID=3469 RepID=UPI000E6F4C2D|nr:uncharacterized protein LOC113279020 [Papaver somniferum]
MTYKEDLSALQESITSVAKKLDTLTDTITNFCVLDEDAQNKKAAEKLLQKEQEGTALADRLTTSLRTLFTEFFPPNHQNNGAAPLPPPPPPPPVNHGVQQLRPNSVNIKFPTFNGEDPDDWIFNVDKYFSVYNNSDALKIIVACAHLKGEDNIWYRWKRTRVVVTTWVEFYNLIRARFNPDKFVDARLAISTMDQKGTVHQHISEFEKLLNFVEFPEDYLISCFIRLLKPHIGSVVKLLAPQTLDKAYTKEIYQEAAYAATKFVPKQPYRPPIFRSPIPPQLAQQHQQTFPPGYRRLSPEEQREKRAKGICFKCDQPYIPNHICVNPQLTILDIEEPTTKLAIQAVDSFSATEVDNSVDDDSRVEDVPSISLNSLMGSPFSTTIRITGSSKAQPITVLVDSGFTYNFISPLFAKQCGYHIQSKDTSLRVTVGDGGHIHTQGTCLNIPIQLQNHMFSIDFHVFVVSGCDVVLGVQWLRKLGPIEWDFEKFLMKFKYDGADIQLFGNNSSALMVLDTAPMQKLLRKEVYGFFLQLTAVHNSALITPLIENPEIKKLLSTFQDVFATPISLPPKRLHDHRISLLPDSSPVNVRPYRYPHFQKDEILKIVSKLKQAGFIRPSSSPFSSPILMVRKKDGSWRMCVDYRALNKLTIKDRYPIPMVDELLDELHGVVIFTKLDLRSGYYQIRLYGPDIPKTAFRTHDGHYEFLVMPFGLSNAPATFQILMNHIFKPYLRKFVLVFFDDILIYSSNMQDHIKHLSLVFETLRQHQLFVKESKCTFAQPSVGYLGHIISSEGVAVEKDKIDSVLSWPLPTTVKSLRGFLGLAGYYRKFVKNFGKICTPLTQLLKNDAFLWTEEATSAFRALQHTLTTTPVLILPDFTKEFYLECDASGTGLGDVLMQTGRLIAYYSKALAGKNLNLSIYDKEMLAIVSAVQKWRPYLLGRHFKIYTDHNSLK